MPGMSSGRNRYDGARGASRLEDGPSGSEDGDGRVITYLYGDVSALPLFIWAVKLECPPRLYSCRHSCTHFVYFSLSLDGPSSSRPLVYLPPLPQVPAYSEKRGTATKSPSHLSSSSDHQHPRRLGSSASKWATSAQPHSPPSPSGFSALATGPAWPEKHNVDTRTLPASRQPEHTPAAEDDAWANWGKEETSKSAGETGADAYARRAAMGRGASTLRTSSIAVKSAARATSSIEPSPSKSPRKPASHVQRASTLWTGSPEIEVEAPRSKNNILLDLAGLHLESSQKIVSEDDEMLATRVPCESSNVFALVAVCKRSQ